MRPEEFIKSIEQSIEDIGFKMLFIKNNREGPAYAYTIGLAREGLPDFFISGIPDLNLLSALIELAVAACREQKARGPVIVNQQVNVNTGTPLVLELVNDHELYSKRVLLAKDFYQKKTPFVQIVWPDESGELPTSPDYDAERFPQELFCSKTLH